MEPGVHSSLHSNFLHQIIYSRFNLKIYYRTPCKSEIWHYIKANIDLIQQAIHEFIWGRAFHRKNINEKMSILNNTINNVLSSFIPHETITCDDKEPPWFNKNIINLIKSKSIFYKSHTANENSTDKKEAIKTLQNKLTSTIENAKSEYYSKLSIKLLNPKTSSKAYWSILKSFVNDKKIPIIPPLYHNGNFITDFCQKAELFNSFFAEQCSILLNSSKLPTNLAPRTDQSLTSINFSQDDILKIIQNLNPNKAHGPDKISIRMIKICGKSLCKPLEMIFKSCIKKGEYPSEWKKANVVPVHKKGDKQLLKNYRPISLLPIFGKIFERIIYNNIFEYLTTNKLISDNQSGFKPGDSCVNQLLSITHEIYHSLDNGLEVRGVFLHISKDFGKVWHNGLILNLNQYGILENLLRLIKCFLKNRKQRVVLNGRTPSWTSVLAGVLQGSILIR